MATAATFTHRLRVAALPGTEALVGVENEYSLQFLGQPADFRQIIHSLSIPGRRIDPGDLNAYRLRSGIALTCDESEAEVATPPIGVRPGFVRKVEAWTALARSQLGAVFPPGYTLEGYSTHVSVSVPLDRPEIAGLYARSFGPSLALLMERPESLGIYVRPRPGRLELCADYVDGAELGAAVAFVAGSVRACANVLTGAEGGTLMPPPVEAQLLPAVERYGVRMLRTACGCDLYTLGRQAPLPLVDGRVVSAQEHLEMAWSAARRALGHDLSRDDARYIDDVVAGVRPLGVEAGRASEREQPLAREVVRPTSNEFGRIVDAIRRPGFVLETAVATWDFTLLALSAIGGASGRYILIPRSHLRGFIELAESGELDEPLRSELASAPARRVLHSHAQTSAPGVYDTIDDLNALLAPERDPESGQLLFGRGPGRGAKVAARPGKASGPPAPLHPARPLKVRVEVTAHPPSSPGVPPVASQPRPTSGLPVRGLLAVGAFAVAGAIALVVAMGGGEESSDGVLPTPAPSSAVSAIPSAGASSSARPVATEPAPPTPLPTTIPRPTASPIATATGTPATDTETPRPAPSAAVTPSVPPTVPGAATTTPVPATATTTSTATRTATPTATATRTIEPTIRPTSTPAPVPTATLPPLPTRIPPATIIAATVPAPSASCTPAPGTACP